MSQTHYAKGFFFDESAEYVALIHKNRPAAIAGKLTGLGGHQEEGEDYAQCVAREFCEEAGVATRPEDWTHFATVSTESMYMPCYFIRSNDVRNVQTQEDEHVAVHAVKRLCEQDLAPFTMKLIELARTHSGGVAELS